MSTDTARPASRRDELLSGALRLFREQGYHATSINDIGAAVGVSGPALYRHFESKDDLLAEAILAGAREIGRATREAVAPETTAEGELRAAARAFVELAVQNRDMVAAYMLEARHLPADKRRPLVRNEKLLRQDWSARLARARPELTEAEARLIVRNAVFMVTAVCLHDTDLDPDRTIDLTTSMVTAALFAPHDDRR